MFPLSEQSTQICPHVPAAPAKLQLPAPLRIYEACLAPLQHLYQSHEKKTDKEEKNKLHHLLIGVAGRFKEQTLALIDSFPNASPE